MSELQKIKKAYLQLLKNDGYLLEKDVNERSITHRFAIYLEKEFPEWNVDCEYNRNGLDPKTLVGLKENISSDDEKARTVYPDIIIHHRGTKDNFIVVEAKKDKYQDIARKKDEEKLKAYQLQLGYKHAFFVTFSTDGGFIDLTEKQLTDFIKPYCNCCITLANNFE